MPARPTYNVDYNCSGCNKRTTQGNKTKEFKSRLCVACYNEWEMLDKKATAYLKEIRKHAPWS